MGSDSHPLFQRATLVRFKMAPTNPPQLRWIDDFAQARFDFREHSTQPGMKKQRLIVLNQKMIELKING